MTNISEATSFGATSTTDDVLSGVKLKGAHGSDRCRDGGIGIVGVVCGLHRLRDGNSLRRLRSLIYFGLVHPMEVPMKGYVCLFLLFVGTALFAQSNATPEEVAVLRVQQ